MLTGERKDIVRVKPGNVNKDGHFLAFFSAWQMLAMMTG